MQHRLGPAGLPGRGEESFGEKLWCDYLPKLTVSARGKVIVEFVTRQQVCDKKAGCACEKLHSGARATYVNVR